MGENGDSKAVYSVTVALGGLEGKVEKLLSEGDRPERIRISCWNPGHDRLAPLEISEKELVVLLVKAVRAGILSPDFLTNLHDEFEI